ncbi:cell adhesion molecule 1-like isoform X3 [Lingula anatina]|uniref:Cell adhesion molecule 1-like isoform X3 n=1 Tax=Lingula anatina TaxID=7574 RepID=A0A1S3KEN1_LINAN|nr:cell adhesion molecule 1-like isoform X3 [Lingula anatina]|eukprot:XP_013420914.1 cell adhesion molecule 1-like isoform X3 [Lingula anatina]
MELIQIFIAVLVIFYPVNAFDVAKSGQTYIQAGSQTTLTCRWAPLAAGEDLLRVNWRQGSTVIASAILPNYTPVYADTKIKNRVTLGNLTSSSPSTSITLTGLQCPGDIAEYACDVFTTALQDSSGTAGFDVNLFDFMGNNVTITSSSSRLQAGQNASLTCTASNIGRPPGTIKWQRNSQDITTGFTQQKSINSDNCTYNGVSILSISPTSQDDGVMYKCVVDPNSAVIGDSRKEGRYTLDVQYPVRQGPRVTSSTGTFTVEQGTTFTLNCQASGNPSPNYVWTSPDNTNTTGSQLVLTLSSTGTFLYTCFATNSLTTTPLPTGVTVTVQEKTTTTTTTSTTTVTTPTAVASTTQSQLPEWAIAIIVVVCVLVILAVVIAVVIMKRRKGNKEKTLVDNKPPNNYTPEAYNGPYPAPDVLDSSQRYPDYGMDTPPRKPPINDQYDPRSRNVENLVYAELALDDTPRSRKPIQAMQLDNSVEYAEIKRV